MGTEEEIENVAGAEGVESSEASTEATPERFDLGEAIEEVAAGLGKQEKETETATEAEPSETTEKAPEAEPASAPATEPVEDSEAPKTWRKEAAEAFKTLPKVVQDEVRKREDDIFRGIEHYKADAQFGQKLRSALSDHIEVLERHNVPVEAQIRAVMDAHNTLTFGSPQQKLEIVKQIIQDYGVDAASVVAEVGMIPAEVAELQRQNRMLQSRLDYGVQQQRIESEAAIMREIQDFAADPGNKHFQALIPDITAIIRGTPGIKLKDAYEKAVWANPTTRNAELAAQQAKLEQAAKEAAEEKRKQVAMATAANVKSSAKKGSAAAPVGTMEDTIRAALEEITSRD